MTRTEGQRDRDTNRGRDKDWDRDTRINTDQHYTVVSHEFDVFRKFS